MTAYAYLPRVRDRHLFPPIAQRDGTSTVSAYARIAPGVGKELIRKRRSRVALVPSASLLHKIPIHGRREVQTICPEPSPTSFASIVHTPVRGIAMPGALEPIRTQIRESPSGTEPQHAEQGHRYPLHEAPPARDYAGFVPRTLTRRCGGIVAVLPECRHRWMPDLLRACCFSNTLLAGNSPTPPVGPGGSLLIAIRVLFESFSARRRAKVDCLVLVPETHRGGVF